MALYFMHDNFARVQQTLRVTPAMEAGNTRGAVDHDVWHAVALMVATLASGLASPTTMKDLTFLTRDGCVNTPDLVNNLDDALKALGLPNDYQFIDIGKLPAKDLRTGYPTPTVLWKGKDILGMPAPRPPYDVPS